MKKTITVFAVFYLYLLSIGQMSAQVEFTVGNVSSNCGDNICMPITVYGFENINSLSGSVNWDNNELSYSGVTNVALPDFASAANLNETNVGDGNLGFVWFDLTGLTPVTLTNGSVLMEICFVSEALGNNINAEVQLSDSPTTFAVSQQPDDPTSPPYSLPFTLNAGTNNILTGCSGSNSLTCNDHINITTNPWSCSASLNPQMALEGGPYDYSVMEIMPQELTADDLEQSIVYTVTDTQNGSTCLGTVTLEDKTPPVAVSYENLVIQLDNSCKAKVYSSSMDNGHYDSCTEVTVSPEYFELDESHLGDQELVLVVTDEYGNSNSISQSVKVVGSHCAEPLQVYEQVNIVVNGDESFSLYPEMAIVNDYASYDQFAINPLFVDTTDLGTLPYFVTSLDGDTDWGNLNVCETAATITNCSKILQTIAPNQTAVVNIDQAMLEINYTCTENGYFTSFSNTVNNMTTRIYDCSYADLPGGISEYSIYLWTGNILVDSCTNSLQILDGQGNCDNVITNGTLACNDYIEVSANQWGCDALLIPQMALEGGPYDYSTMTITPTQLNELNEVVQYTVEDTATGNLCWGTVKLLDKTPPVAIAVQNLVVSLTTNPGNPDPLKAKIYADQVDNGSHDGSCGPVALKPEFWEVTCADLGELVLTMEVWDDADGDGVPGSSSGDNFSTVWTTVKVELPTGLVIVCPSSRALTCDEDLSDPNVTGVPQVTLGCQDALTYDDTDGFDENEDGDLYDSFERDGVTYSENYNRTCNFGSLVREWKIGDISCTQHIFVANDTEFTGDDITWPEDKVVSCYDDEPDAPSWNSVDGCALVSWTIESDTIINSGLPCIKIINNYRLINWCEYDPAETNVGIWYHTAIVEIAAPSAPELFVEFATLTGCGDLSLTSTANYGSCPNAGLRWKVSVDINSDSNIDAIWSSFTVEDGNTASSPLWDDDDGDGIPEVRVGNTGGVDNAASNRVKAGSPYKINLPSWLSSIMNPDVPHNVVWEVYSECGAMSSANSTFFVESGTSDTNAPIPYCLNLATVIVQGNGIDIYAIDFDLGSFDNCTPDEELRFTFTDVEPEADPNYLTAFRSSYLTLTPDQFPLQMNNMSVPMYVWDNFGNKDFCLVNLRVQVEHDVVVDPCFVEDDINWPDAVIDVYTDSSNNTSPSALIELYDFAEDQVLPIVPDCGIYSYDDVLFDVGTVIKIVRRWTVLDWVSALVYEFNQVINIYPGALSNICDFLPNNTPFTDCDNGHSMDDDVEWPADISIADHRITPEGLMTFSNIPAKDAQPEFFNDAVNYTATYENFIPVFTIPLLEIERRWTVSNTNFVGSTANYTQKITVDLTDIIGLVATATFKDRPIPGVQVTPQDMTDEGGLIIVDENATVNPAYSDANYNGLTVRDLLMIQWHILGIEDLENYELHSADFNGDDVVDGRDLVELRKHILSVYTGDLDWRFIERPATLEELGIKGDYIGIKPGDVDDSAALGDDAPDYEDADFIIDDLLLNDGETYTVPVKYSSPSILSLALNLSMDFDEDALELLSVTSNVYGIVNYSLSNNVLNLVVLSGPASPILIDTDLIQLQVKAKSNTTIANVIGFIGDKPSHILTDQMELLDMNGSLESPFGSGTHELDGEHVSVYPNPVSSFLTVALPAVYTKDFSFEIFDISGKSVKAFQNETTLDVTDIPSGIYLYKLMVGNRLFSDKIIIQK